MHKIREKIEVHFKNLTSLIYKKSLATLILTAVITGGLMTNLPKITFDPSTEGFLHENDPVLIEYHHFRELFGPEEMIVIALNPKNIFDLKFLKKLKALHKELEEKVPHLTEITSLINARETRGKADELIVKDLLEKFPKTKKDIEVLKEKVTSNPFYKNLLVSEDNRFTTIVLKTDSFGSNSSNEESDDLSGFDDEPITEIVREKADFKALTQKKNFEVVESVKAIVSRYKSLDFPLQIAGSPVLVHELGRAMQRDMKRFLQFGIFAIAITLFLLFRRKSGVFIPLAIVLISLLSTVSIMAMLGTSIKLPTMTLPSFLLAVGVGDSIHILSLFYRKYDREGDKEKAIVYAMGHSGLPILLTSVTTAVGLASFATAEVAPIADLGLFASGGVMLALFYTIVLIPALVSLLDIKRKVVTKADEETMLDRMIIKTADISTGHPKKIVFVSGLIIFVGLFLASQLKFTHNPLLWLPDEMEVKQATQKIDQELKGTTTIEVIIDTGKENGLYEPSILKKIDHMQKEMEKVETKDLFIKKTIAITDILKEIHKALNENRDEFFAVPDNRKLIAQEFLLFENSGSDDLESIVDSQFSKTRFTMKVPWIDSVAYGKFIPVVQKKFQDEFGDDIKISVTGIGALLGRTLYAAIVSAAKSYITAFGLIAVIMVLLIGDLKIGLASMIPNLAPIIISLGMMKIFAIPLDMFTMLIGSIAIGLAVDDTIHFMHNFRRYYHLHGSAREAVYQTLHTAGRAMLVTSVVLATGFYIFMFSFMNNIFNFGFLTGTTIILALLADFLLSPAILTLITEHEEKKLKGAV